MSSEQEAEPESLNADPAGAANLKSSSGDNGRQVPWLALCVPLALAVVILSLSPNFKQVDGLRNSSLGGDFLQEWVGGYISSSDESARVYDLEYFRSIQHEPEVVGFEWPESKYFPAVYPPFFYQAMQPVSKIPYPLASKIWLLVSAMAVSVSGWLLFRFYKPSRKFLGVAVIAMVVFVPLLNCLNMGQKSTILLLILTSTFLLLHHGKPLSAGLVFGLIAFKPHLGLVIGLTMLLKRQWSFAAGAVLTVGLMVGASWLTNPQLWNDYFEVVLGMKDYVESGGYQLTDSHSLWGAMQLGFSPFEAPSWLIKLLTGVSMVFVIGLVWRFTRGPVETQSATFAWQFSGLVIATVMLSPHFYSYDLSVLLLPMLLVGGAIGGINPKCNSIRLVGGLMLVIFLFGGLFQTLAVYTGIQFSILCLIAILFLISPVIRNVYSC